MKIKNTFLILFGTMLFFGCNWQIPQKATVKASPTFNFSAGTIKNDLSKQINLDSIVDDMLESGSEQFGVYNYCPNEDAPKSFALRFSIAEVPVDFSEYIKNSGISDAISGLSFEQRISVPEISFNHTAKIDISEIKKGINNLVIYNNSVIPDTKNGFILDFSKIVYKNCTINITGSIPNGTRVNIESDHKDINGYIYNNTCSIKVSDFTIDSEKFYVTFDDNKDYPYLITVDEDSEIASVHNVNSPENISFPFEMSFSLSDANTTNFESCEIADGKLITDLKVPSTWSGVSVDYNFTSTGGIEVNADKNGNLKKEIQLTNTSISNKKTTSNSDIEISLSNATLDFTNEDEAMQIEISSEINQLKSLCIELDDVKTDINYSEKLPQEVIDSVKKINLNSLTLNVEYTNTFPQGNDIKLNTKSDIFNIDNSITLKGGSENQTEKITSTDKNEIKLGDGGYDSYDFTGKLTLPGATSEKPNRILISNVALGEDYFISLKLTPEIDWESIVLSDKLTDSMSQKGKMNLPVNINELIKNMSSSFKIDDLLKKVQLDSLPIYLYCTKPTFENSTEDPFKDIKFKGNISIYYGTEDQAEFTKTIQDHTDSILFKDYPKINFSSDRKKILSDFKETSCSIKADLADIINKSLSSTSENSSLFVDYNLSLDGGTDNEIEIRSEMLSDGGSLGIFAYVVLPLKFKTVSNITLDAAELAGDSLNGDIFGRKDANSDMNDLEQYIDYIRKASFNYQITQLPFNTNKNAVKLNAGLILGEGNNPEKINLTENSSLQSGTISIKSDDIKKVLKSYPANLDLKINIGNGTEFSIPQQMNLELNLAISIETDIEMEF